MKKAIIIGAGIGGIATSIRLALKGYHVQVMEASQGPGGKLCEFSSNGYRFDFGPSLFTLPGLVDELFEISGMNPREFFNYIKLEESCKYFYEDGLKLTAFADQAKFEAEINEKTGVNPSVIKKYFDHSKLIFDYTRPIFLEKSLHKLSSFLNYETIRALSRAHEFDLMESMHDANLKRIKEPHLVQLFDRYATYNGSNPYKAPGILNLIPSLEHLDGSYFPHGGMYQITDSLVALAEKIGVTFHYGHNVDHILTDSGGVSGVSVDGEKLAADVVVSNMDVYLTYKKLLSDQHSANKALKQERSSSALVFYWGINKRFDELGLHNILFSNDYRHEFEQIFTERTIADDPTVYINITSKLNPTDAPTGRENWFVMINAPYIEDQNWDEIIQRTRTNTIAKINRMLKTDISELIDFEEVTDPILISKKTSSFKGSLYGTSSNSKMAAFMRHPNFKRKIKNLFFCGGSVHPGGGIPLCLMSAKIVDSLT